MLERVLGSWNTRHLADPLVIPTLVVMGEGIDATIAAELRPRLVDATVAFTRLAAQPPMKGRRDSDQRETIDLEIQPDRHGPLSRILIKGPMHWNRSLSRTDRVEHRDADGEAIVELEWSFFSTDEERARYGFARDLCDFATRIMEAVEDDARLLRLDDAHAYVQDVCTRIRRKPGRGGRVDPSDAMLVVETPWSETVLEGRTNGSTRPDLSEYGDMRGVVVSVTNENDGGTAMRPRIVLSPMRASSTHDVTVDEPMNPMAMLRSAAAEAAFASAPRIDWYER